MVFRGHEGIVMKNVWMMMCAAAFVGAVCMGGTAKASLIFEEYFDYDEILANNSNISGAPGWVGGTNNVRYRNSSQSGQLNFTGTGYVPTHAGGYLESGNSNSTDWRGSNASLGEAISGEIWITTFFNATGMTMTSGAIAYFGLNTNITSNASNGGFPGFGAYYDGTDDFGGTQTLSLALFDGSTPVALGPTISSNQWYLIIARINILAASDDQIDLWLYTANENIPTTVAGLGTADLSSSTLDWGDSINTIQIGGQRIPGGSGGKTTNWDDIRLANLGGDTGLKLVVTLIPEPASAGLLGLAALALLRRRRAC
jgi:hypothetical protein